MATAVAVQREEDPEKLSERLSQIYVEYVFKKRSPLPTNQPLYVNDINEQITILSESIGRNPEAIPCIELEGSIIPINSLRTHSIPIDSETFYKKHVVEEHAFDNIKNFIRDRLIGLRTFLGGRDRFQRMGNVQPIYYGVTVHTVNAGLSIDASPAYFINWTYFDHPSTPAQGNLLGGRWVFAGSSASMNLKKANSIVQIPNTLNVDLYDF